MLETILEFALVLALAGFFVMWAKWEEEKVKTREERDRRWDEISLRRTVEKEKDAEIAKLNSCINSETDRANRLVFEIGLVEDDRAYLQDKLSALLCPRNDHVWKDGVCAKCGRSEQK